MAKKHRIRHSFRRIKHRSRKMFTPIRVIKYIIALGPPAATVYANFKEGGTAQTALGTLGLMYTGFDLTNPNPENRANFQPKWLVLGYGSLLGAWLFGKVASRVLR